MDKNHPREAVKKMKELQCLKIVESIVKGDTKTADKHLKKLIERRLGNKINYILHSENLI